MSAAADDRPASTLNRWAMRRYLRRYLSQNQTGRFCGMAILPASSRFHNRPHSLCSPQLRFQCTQNWHNAQNSARHSDIQPYLTSLQGWTSMTSPDIVFRKADDCKAQHTDPQDCSDRIHRSTQSTSVFQQSHTTSSRTDNHRRRIRESGLCHSMPFARLSSLQQ